MPLSSVSQTHDPKMNIDPIGKIMLSKFVELLIVIALKPYLARQLSVFNQG
jgi:hypothetical protein